MLILLGLSGVLPMTHAALQFGIAQARRQMGWDWYIWEAICYLLGALIYSVRTLPAMQGEIRLSDYRSRSRSVGTQVCLIYGGVRIKSSMYVWFWVLHAI